MLTFSSVRAFNGVIDENRQKRLRRGRGSRDGNGCTVRITKIKLFALAALPLVCAWVFLYERSAIIDPEKELHSGNEQVWKEVSTFDQSPIIRSTNSLDEEQDSNIGESTALEKPTSTPSKYSLSLDEKEVFKDVKAKMILANHTKLNHEIHRQFLIPEYYRQLSRLQHENSSVIIRSVEKRYESYLKSRLKDQELLAIARKLRLSSKTSLVFANQLNSLQPSYTHQVSSPNQSKTPMSRPIKKSHVPADIRTRLVREIASALTVLVSIPKQ